MADKPENDLPKVPPFIIPGAPNQHAEEPTFQNAHVVQAPKASAEKDNFVSQRGMVSLAIALISMVSLGVSMLSGAWFAYGILKDDDKEPAATVPAPEGTEPTATPTATPDPQAPTPTVESEGEDADKEKNDEAETDNKQGQIVSSVIVIGLIFAVGWISGVYAIRTLGNLILPFVIQVYTFFTLGGILFLQFKIIEKLFMQEYGLPNFIKYLSMFAAGMIALVALHLMLEKHSLIFFAILILFTSLAHLYFIAFHYIFLPDVKHELIWGDIIFFLVTTTTSALMIAHLGLLNGARRFIARTFNPKDNLFVPPN